MLVFAAIGGGLRPGEQAVMRCASMGGGAGLLIWYRSGAAHASQGVETPSLGLGLLRLGCRRPAVRGTRSRPIFPADRIAPGTARYR